MDWTGQPTATPPVSSAARGFPARLPRAPFTQRTSPWRKRHSAHAWRLSARALGSGGRELVLNSPGRIAGAQEDVTALPFAHRSLPLPRAAEPPSHQTWSLSYSLSSVASDLSGQAFPLIAPLSVHARAPCAHVLLTAGAEAQEWARSVPGRASLLCPQMQPSREASGAAKGMQPRLAFPLPWRCPAVSGPIGRTASSLRQTWSLKSLAALSVSCKRAPQCPTHQGQAKRCKGPEASGPA